MALTKSATISWQGTKNVSIDVLFESETEAQQFFERVISLLDAASFTDEVKITLFLNGIKDET